MKKIISILLFVVIAAGVLTGCGSGLSGTYVADDGETVIFSGKDKITMDAGDLGTVEGTYVIDGNKLLVEGVAGGVYGVSAEFTFTKDGKTITLNGNGKIYTKK